MLNTYARTANYGSVVPSRNNYNMPWSAVGGGSSAAAAAAAWETVTGGRGQSIC